MKPDNKNWRRIDDLYPSDNWGRKSRFYWKKENIERLGFKYKKGRAYKIIIKKVNFKNKILANVFFSQHGLAPKVYRVGNFKWWKFIEMDYVPRRKTDILMTRTMIEVASRDVDFIKIYEHDLVHRNNYRYNKFVDYHGFEIDLPKFKSWLYERIKQDTHWGHKNDKNENYPYQTFSDFKGKRQTIYRIGKLGLDQIDFKGKSVLDIGCNMGVFLYYAKEEGADKLVGVDIKEVIRLAELYEYYKTNGGIEFYGETLTPDTIDKYGKFDVVLYLAMVHSLEYPEKLKKITKELLIFEGHNLMDKNKTENELSKIFNKVIFKGFTEDRGSRPVFWCYV